MRFAAFPILLGGCAELPDLGYGTCGNHIVDRGEDCDGFPADTCNPPGSPAQCRLSCDASTGTGCPDGWGCGADGVCRSSTGRFGVADRLPGSTPLALFAGDFDGNRVDDVLVAEPSRFALQYQDVGGALAKTLSLPMLPSRPAVGDLSEDGRADFALAILDVAVMRGRADRTLANTAYAPFSLANTPAESVRVLALDAMVTPDHAGDEVLALTPDQGLMSPMDEVELFGVSFDAYNLAGDIQIGQIDMRPTSPCDEFVLASWGESQAKVFTPCSWDSANATSGWNQDATQQRAVSLPPNVGIGGGVLLLDVNDDGKLDLLVGGMDATNPFGVGLYVAYGLGDGGFDPDPAALSPGSDTVLATPLLTLPDFPLAAGYIDDDGALDFVLPSAIVASGSGLTGVCPDIPAGYGCIPANGATWSTAAIADFNANGLPDVIAGSAGSFKLDFFNRTPEGQLNHFDIPTQGPVDRIAIGDFDGDLVLDAAVRQRAQLGVSTSADTLGVAFGQAVGPPEAPVEMARFGQIQQVVAGNFVHLGPELVPELDGTTDLVVISSGQLTDEFGTGNGDEPPPPVEFGSSPASASMFFGSGDRQLRSPFTIFGDTGRLAAARVVQGEFDGDGHADLAVLTMGEADVQQVWLLPSTQEAALDANTARPSLALPQALNPCFSQLVSVDLDGDGIDEIVALGPRELDNTPKGRVDVLRSVDDGTGQRHFELDPQPLETPEAYVERLLPGELCSRFMDTIAQGPRGSGGPEPGTSGSVGGEVDPYGLPGHAQVGDIDGDGRLDVVALGLEVGADFSTSTTLVVYRNDGSGRLDASSRTVVIPSSFELTGFTLVNADDDPALEIARANWSGIEIAGFDPASGGLSGSRTIPDVFGSEVVSGDFTGDGVDDLVVSSYDGAVVLAGVPVLK